MCTATKTILVLLANYYSSVVQTFKLIVVNEPIYCHSCFDFCTAMQNVDIISTSSFHCHSHNALTSKTAQFQHPRSQQTYHAALRHGGSFSTRNRPNTNEMMDQCNNFKRENVKILFKLQIRKSKSLPTLRLPIIRTKMTSPQNLFEIQALFVIILERLLVQNFGLLLFNSCYFRRLFSKFQSILTNNT